MGDEQKIWFVYLTDHHEGPFTVSEISAKQAQGLVNKQTLAWKDGMAEWVAIETIPDLAIIFKSTAAQETEAAPAGGGGEEPSLAAMLAQSQADPASDSGMSLAIEDSAPAPSAAPAPSPASSLPSDDEAVWNLRMGGAVSGSFSMNQLKEMAKAGEIQDGFELWAPGLTDFLPGTTYPDLIAAKKAGGTKSSLSSLAKKSVGAKKIAAPTKAAVFVDDEPTDPNITAAPEKLSLLQKLKNLFPKKQEKKVTAFSPKAVSNGNFKAKGKSSGIDIGGLLKRIVLPVLAIAALGGGGAYYYLFMMSPIPAMEDVKPDDLEKMKAVVKVPVNEGVKFHFAQAIGDEITPTIYIATNLNEGSVITMDIRGVPGTLVNAVSFQKKLTAPVTKNQLAAFGPINNESKPIPMGDYSIVLTADGGAKQEYKVFIGGKKTGPIYERRMKQYKEKLQASYDQEIQELREFIQTLKTMKEDLDKKVANLRAGAGTLPAANAWRVYSQNFAAIAAQMDQKIKEKVASETPDRYYPGTYKDIQTVFGQVNQLFQTESERFAGKITNNADLNALTQAGLQSLEQFIAQAVVRTPLDVLVAKEQSASGTPPAAATPVAPAAIAAPAAPASTHAPVTPAATVPAPVNP